VLKDEEIDKTSWLDKVVPYQDLMTIWLHAEGYRVRTARNGREALVVLRHEVPWAMVVDLTLPMMDATELRRSNRSCRRYHAALYSCRRGTPRATNGPRPGQCRRGGEAVGAERLLSIIASPCHGVLEFGTAFA
jgi:DNA-binding NtrC family response regulator